MARHTGPLCLSTMDFPAGSSDPSQWACGKNDDTVLPTTVDNSNDDDKENASMSGKYIRLIQLQFHVLNLLRLNISVTINKANEMKRSQIGQYIFAFTKNFDRNKQQISSSVQQNSLVTIQNSQNVSQNAKHLDAITSTRIPVATKTIRAIPCLLPIDKIAKIAPITHSTAVSTMVNSAINNNTISALVNQNNAISTAAAIINNDESALIDCLNQNDSNSAAATSINNVDSGLIDSLHQTNAINNAVSTSSSDSYGKKATKNNIGSNKNGIFIQFCIFRNIVNILLIYFIPFSLKAKSRNLPYDRSVRINRNCLRDPATSQNPISNNVPVLPESLDLPVLSTRASKRRRNTSHKYNCGLVVCSMCKKSFRDDFHDEYYKAGFVCSFKCFRKAQ